MIGIAPICEECKHYQPEVGKAKCSAYPDGIPEAILDGSVDHHKPHTGDQGIQFTSI